MAFIARRSEDILKRVFKFSAQGPILRIIAWGRFYIQHIHGRGWHSIGKVDKGERETLNST